MRLSANFTLEEFLLSETAARQGIDNTPDEAVVANLKRLAERLELVRAIFNSPVVISSGYRCPALNKAVGGVPNSAHMTGCAADFIVPGMGAPLQIAQRITKYDIPFDQLINEYGQWVHFAIEPGVVDPRRECWTYRRGEAPLPYLC